MNNKILFLGIFLVFSSCSYLGKSLSFDKKSLPNAKKGIIKKSKELPSISSLGVLVFISKISLRKENYSLYEESLESKGFDFQNVFSKWGKLNIKDSIHIEFCWNCYCFNKRYHKLQSKLYSRNCSNIRDKLHKEQDKIIKKFLSKSDKKGWLILVDKDSEKQEFEFENKNELIKKINSLYPNYFQLIQEKKE